jgi:hypothetical protein
VSILWNRQHKAKRRIKIAPRATGCVCKKLFYFWRKLPLIFQCVRKNKLWMSILPEYPKNRVLSLFPIAYSGYAILSASFPNKQ